MLPISSRNRVPREHARATPLCAGGIGERVGLESEEFAFQQGVGKRGAVQFEPGLATSWAGVVNRASEHILSHSALALNQDRRVIGIGSVARNFEHLPIRMNASPPLISPITRAGL